MISTLYDWTEVYVCLVHSLVHRRISAEAPGGVQKQAPKVFLNAVGLPTFASLIRALKAAFITKDKAGSSAGLFKLGDKEWTLKSDSPKAQ